MTERACSVPVLSLSSSTFLSPCLLLRAHMYSKSASDGQTRRLPWKRGRLGGDEPKLQLPQAALVKAVSGSESSNAAPIRLLAATQKIPLLCRTRNSLSTSAAPPCGSIHPCTGEALHGWVLSEGKGTIDKWRRGRGASAERLGESEVGCGGMWRSEREGVPRGRTCRGKSVMRDERRRELIR